MQEFCPIGTGVALVTPFCAADESIDYQALARLIEFHIASGVDYLVVLGTTGENPTLSVEERAQVRKFVATHTAGRIPLVAGIGGNCTKAVCEELQLDDLTGYSAVLSIVPFYNKPSQQGIYAHFHAVEQASPLPVILYNVPSRTGVNMSAITTLALAHDHHRIIAIKEASGDLVQCRTIIENAPEHFSVISGDDASTLQLVKLGAKGVISVAANAFPKEMKQLVDSALAGDYAQAQQVQDQLQKAFSLLFAEGNPSGVKCLLSKIGLCSNVLRLPLTPVSDELSLKFADIAKNI